MTTIDDHDGLRFMGRFQCLCGACEDPCCGQWQIPVDDVHFRAIEQALGETETARAVKKLPVVDQQPDQVGNMALDDRGFCVMLEHDNLCSLHRRFGEAVLSDMCAIYPRSIGRAGARAEMSGLTSCPEVVRLCLWADDAVDVVPLPPEKFLRPMYAHELDDARQSRFGEIRDLMIELLRRPFPMATRQAFLAALAHRVDALDAEGAPAR